MGAGKSQTERQSSASIDELTYACTTHDPFIWEGFQERYRFAATFLNRDAVAIDVGCGPGYGTKILAEKAGRAYGLDFNASAIALAKQQYALSNIEYHCTDIFEFDLPSAHCDLVTCFEVLEHVKEPEKIIERCLRWLKPGGKAIFSTPNRIVHMILRYVYEFHEREYGYSEIWRMFRAFADESDLQILGQNPKGVEQAIYGRGRFRAFKAPIRRLLRTHLPRPLIARIRKWLPKQVTSDTTTNPELMDTIRIADNNVDLAETFIIVVTKPLPQATGEALR